MTHLRTALFIILLALVAGRPTDGLADTLADAASAYKRGDFANAIHHPLQAIVTLRRNVLLQPQTREDITDWQTQDLTGRLAGIRSQ